MALYIIDNRQTPIGFETESETARVMQNAKNLLMCRMGELPYNRLRGFNPALYDMPIQKLREELMPELDSLMAYEPRVKVADAECSLDERGDVFIRVTIDIQG